MLIRIYVRKANYLRVLFLFVFKYLQTIVNDALRNFHESSDFSDLAQDHVVNYNTVH